MITRKIGETEVPALGLGTWMLEGREAREGVRDALAIGYRHVDTAQAYGNEEEVGRGLADAGVPRDEVFVTTKVWRDDLRADDLLRTTHDSLRRLGLEQVDLLLVHWPNPAIPLDETLGALGRAREKGLTRHIGVSNFPPRLLERALELAPIVCDQVEYHPYLAQTEILAVAQRAGLMVTAYSPLARGELLDDETLQEIGGVHGKTPAQVAIRWLLQQERVAVIPKASSHEHRKANFEVFDFALSPDEMQRIHRLARGGRVIDPSFAPDWGD